MGAPYIKWVKGMFSTMDVPEEYRKEECVILKASDWDKIMKTLGITQ